MGARLGLAPLRRGLCISGVFYHFIASVLGMRSRSVGWPTRHLYTARASSCLSVCLLSSALSSSRLLRWAAAWAKVQGAAQLQCRTLSPAFGCQSEPSRAQVATGLNQASKRAQLGDNQRRQLIEIVSIRLACFISLLPAGRRKSIKEKRKLGASSSFPSCQESASTSSSPFLRPARARLAHSICAPLGSLAVVVVVGLFGKFFRSLIFLL